LTKQQVLVATDLTEESLQLLHEAENVNVQVVPPKTSVLRTALADANALISREDLILDVSLLDQAPNLRLIGRMSAGLSGIDMETATARGILVMNMPGVSAIAAAEHTLMLMLALSRKLIINHNSIKEGWWLLDRKRQAGTQVAGKTLGIIGLGRVGKEVAVRALSFGMDVIAYDPYLVVETVPDTRVQLVGFRELLGRSDYITLHVPLTRETQLLIDEDALRHMKEGVRLINTSHGRILDEDALAQALLDGSAAGAAIDTFAHEPPYNSPLIGLENVVHTPHIGDNTLEAMQDLSINMVQQVLDALNDKDYRNVVNMPLLPGVDFETVRPYMRLAECIGSLNYALARSPVKRVGIELLGDEMSGMIKPITVGVLKGLLAPILGDKVSYINAPILATERGWQMSQVKGLKSTDYSNVVICQVTLEDGEEITISGTLLDRREPQIVQINQYRTHFVPEGDLLIMGSYDKPGVIGKIGTLMSDNNVNIASWQTGRSEPGGHTLTILTLDYPLEDDVMAKVRELDFVRHVRQVRI